jgi:hypothetical protein
VDCRGQFRRERVPRTSAVEIRADRRFRQARDEQAFALPMQDEVLLDGRERMLAALTLQRPVCPEHHQSRKV